MRRKLKYKGLFFPNKLDATGHIDLSEKSIDVSLVGDLYEILREDTFDIHGKLSDGTSISLLECIKNKAITFHSRDQRALEVNIHSHIVVAGSEIISSNESRVSKIMYQCKGAHVFCEYKNTFGLLHPTAEELRALVEADEEKTKKIVSGWVPLHRDDFGEHPLIAFFDGNHEIANVDLPGEKISIWNNLSCSMGSAKGVRMDNAIYHTIEFKSPKTVRESLNKLQNVHRFYELLIGSRQKYKEIRIVLEGMDEGSSLPLKVLWNGCNFQVKKRRDPISSDIPILASLERENFERVMAGWMDSSPSMSESRSRLFNGLLKGVFSHDRIIGAANMYDLLPEEKIPENEILLPSVADAVSSTKKTFRSLEQSSARDSVLSTLGRIGKPSLKAKILGRGVLVNNAMGLPFKNLDLVCHQGVVCRNHYVHGSGAGFNYEENFSSFAFLTETLELIFAAADLLDCGWDPANYISRHGTMSHFFGQYIYSYEKNLLELEGLIKK